MTEQDGSKTDFIYPPNGTFTPDEKAERERIRNLTRAERLAHAREDARRRRVQMGLPPVADEE